LYSGGGEALATRLPREVGDAPFLGTFQVGLDGALSNLIQLKMSYGRGVGLDDL